MSKKGRDFERLVASIEKSLAPYGAIITSPHRIKDRDTGTWREIDATIQHKIGPTDILIAIECRDRSSIDDATWIEQLASKMKSVGANIMIAVSSRGFTTAAIKKAQREGIETRTLRKIKPKDIKSWITSASVNVIQQSLISLGGRIEIYFREGDASEISSDLISGDKKWLRIFLWKNTQLWLSLPEFFLVELSKERPKHEEEIENRGPQEIWIERNYEPGELSVKSNNGDRFVKNIRVGFEYTLHNSALELITVREYASGDKILANSIEFSGQVRVKDGVVPINTLITSRTK